MESEHQAPESVYDAWASACSTSMAPSTAISTGTSLPAEDTKKPGTHAGVGLAVGYAVGHAVGAFVGDAVGAFVGEVVGAFVGDAVGAFVGDIVGDIVGACVGDTVGDAVGIATHAVAPS